MHISAAARGSGQALPAMTARHRHYSLAVPYSRVAPSLLSRSPLLHRMYTCLATLRVEQTHTPGGRKTFEAAASHHPSLLG